MKQGKSLTELAAEIERQRGEKRDYIADTRQITMQNDATLSIAGNGNAMPLADVAHRQVGERIQIPAKYYERMRRESPELLAHNVNHWMRENPERRMVRTLDGQVRAFLSDRYQRIDNYDVAQVALPILSEVGYVRVLSTEITESKLYIKAVTSAVQIPVNSRRVGDLVEAGVMITNSEVGLGAINIKPFAHFLVCLNGMVRDKATLRAAHVGRRVEDGGIDGLLSDGTKRLEDLAVLSKVRDVIKAAFDEARFREWIDSMNETTKQPIEGDVPAVVEALAEHYTLGGDERSSVLRHLIEGGDLSRYGLVNAVTRTAEDVASYDRATELETIGGNLIDLPFSDWRVISKSGMVRS
jgi:hypothetical protein